MHTTGAWVVNIGDLHNHSDDPDDHGDGFHITMGNYSRRGGYVIHAIRYAEDVWPEDKDYQEARANAYLIAAAPEMLSALRAARARLALVFGPDRDPRDDATVREIDAAIERATS